MCRTSGSNCVITKCHYQELRFGSRSRVFLMLLPFPRTRSRNTLTLEHTNKHKTSAAFTRIDLPILTSTKKCLSNLRPKYKTSQYRYRPKALETCARAWTVHLTTRIFSHSTVICTVNSCSTYRSMHVNAGQRIQDAAAC